MWDADENGKHKTEMEFIFSKPSWTSAPNWILNGFLTQRSSHSSTVPTLWTEKRLEELQNAHQLLQLKQLRPQKYFLFVELKAQG